MPTTHRGNEVGGNYRPTPRLAQLVASYPWGYLTSNSIATSNAQYDLDSYRTLRDSTAPYAEKEGLPRRSQAIGDAFKSRHSLAPEPEERIQKRNADSGAVHARERYDAGIRGPRRNLAGYYD